MRTPLTLIFLSSLALTACGDKYDDDDTWEDTDVESDTDTDTDTDSDTDTDTDTDSDTDTDVEPEADLSLDELQDIGERLVEGEGMTVYLLSKDTPAFDYDDAVSSCVDGCAEKWFAVAPGEAVGEGLDAADMGKLTRADGYEQATWKGWPLYTFVNDEYAGDANGEGIAGQFFTVPKNLYTVMPKPAGEAIHLIDAEGFSLYTFANDTKGQGGYDPVSACTGGCRDVWPIVDGSWISLPPGLDASEFSAFDRPDGGTQLAFRGWPLYRFANDEKPGDINGDGKAEGAFKLADPS